MAPILVDDESTVSTIGLPGFNPRRNMGCHQGAAAQGRDLGELEDFEVFGGVPPSAWLLLSALQRDDDPLVQQGARLLAQLVWHRMPALGLPDMQMPSFVQLQMLERGSGIMPHLDAATPRAEGVATIGLVGYCQASLGLRARGYEVTTRLRLRVQGIGLRWLS